MCIIFNWLFFAFKIRNFISHADLRDVTAKRYNDCKDVINKVIEENNFPGKKKLKDEISEEVFFSSN